MPSFGGDILWYGLCGLLPSFLRAMPGKHSTWANASSQVRPLKEKHTDPAAGTSSHLLLAGKRLPFVIVSELTPCQSAHLESVRKKEEHESQGLRTLPSSFL